MELVVYFLDHTFVSERQLSVLDVGKLHAFSASRGAFLLRTCHRIEVYCQSEISDPFYLFFNLNGRRIFGRDAYKRFIEVATGLHSEILGESAILLQMEKALEASPIENGFRVILEKGLQLARQVRIKHEWFRTDHSAVALQVAKVEIEKRYGRSKVYDLVIVGSGMLALSASRSAKEIGISCQHIISRSPKAARKRMDLIVSSDAVYTIYEFLNKKMMNPFVLLVATRNVDTEYRALINKVYAREECLLAVDLSSPSILRVTVTPTFFLDSALIGQSISEMNAVTSEQRQFVADDIAEICRT
jgi:glutamyl-tRNA reductase